MAGIQIVHGKNPTKQPKGVIPQMKSIETKKIQLEDIKRGQIWSRMAPNQTKIKDGEKNIKRQVMRKEEVIIVMTKDAFVSFVSKSAFDHGDLCMNWTMKNKHFKKMFTPC